jgi:oligopeptidase A
VTDNTDNPLLCADALPAFSEIRPRHVEPAVDALLEQSRRVVAEISASSSCTWDSIVAPLEEMDDRLNKAWSPVSHLHSVADNPELRSAYNACLPKLSDHATEIGQNEKLFAAFKRLAGQDDFKNFDTAQKRVVENALRDFRLAGVDLDDEDKARFKKISSRLSELASKFEENLLDATQAWKRYLSDAEALAGLPDSALAVARKAAEREGLDGLLLNLEFPCYLAVITYADDRSLRREIYEAYSTRASDQGPHADQWNNGAIMEEILELRMEIAGLLDYPHYAALSLERKMASGCEQVLAFLRDLARRAKPVAKSELEALRLFAKAENSPYPRKSCGPTFRHTAWCRACSRSPAACMA